MTAHGNQNLDNKGVLMGLRPESIEAYLIEDSWFRVESIPEACSIWRLQREDKGPEVIVPLKTSYGDYAIRVSEIITTLSNHKRVPRVVILIDLLVAQSKLRRQQIYERR